MKVLIWFACAFVLSLITVSLKYAGILLGFIPTFILGSLMFWTASTLCKKWDKRKLNKKNITMKKQIGVKSGNKTSKIVCVVINIVAMLLLIASFVLQDEKRNYYEDVAPNMYYIILFITYLLLLVALLFPKNEKYKVCQSVLSMALLLIVIYITVEGSLLSKEYVKYTVINDGESIRIYADYKNADVIFISDIMLLIISVVECTIMLLLSSRILLNKYYMSMSYREKCYKKVSDMQTYLEKGIITQEEFENNKKDILKRIQTGNSL